MHFTLNRAFTAPAGRLIMICLVIAAVAAGRAAAQEAPGELTIVPWEGMAILDNDTLDLERQTVYELQPGEHILRFFPYHTAESAWAHRYLVYPFTIGASGRRTIDLSRSGYFTIRTEPQGAELHYRGRFYGRTPGEFLFLLGMQDSLVVSRAGYENEIIRLDSRYPDDTDIFLGLEKRDSLYMYDEEFAAVHYQSPLRKMLEPELIATLSGGVALLVTGVHFNQKADDYYDKYLGVLGSEARNRYWDKVESNDRISKVCIVAGDIALGAFGYMLIRRFIFPADRNSPEEPRRSRLSIKMGPGRAGLACSF